MHHRHQLVPTFPSVPMPALLPANTPVYNIRRLPTHKSLYSEEIAKEKLTAQTEHSFSSSSCCFFTYLPLTLGLVTTQI